MTRDEDRPPVRAHQRFDAQRFAYQGLDLSARFRKIHEDNLWGAQTSLSGLGSEAEATLAVRHGLPGLLKNLGVTSLLDAPCGDGSWIQMLDWNIRYVGVDIVPALIESLRCQAGKGTFLLCDITKDPLPRADAVLCRDCFVHLSFDNINRAVRNFVASGADWLITTTFPEWRENVDCEDGDWRALNLELPPFGWGPPFYVLNERCNEGAGGWSDKSLAFWSLADLG